MRAARRYESDRETVAEPSGTLIRYATRSISLQRCIDTTSNRIETPTFARQKNLARAIGA
jgi:hypothetical protein